MMNGHDYKKNKPGDDLIESYLDGLMSPEEAKAFLKSVEGNPDVLRELALQKEIDTSLVNEYSLSSTEADSLEKKIETLLNEPFTAEQSLIESYLDGQMSPEEAKAFLKSVEGNPEVQRELALQKEIDSSLAKEYSMSWTEAESLEKKIKTLLNEPDTIEQPVELEQPVTTVTEDDRQNSAWSRPLRMALAASLLVGLGVAIWAYNPPVDPVSGTRALTSVYTETKVQGFRPYYSCVGDYKRFADTFEARQSRRLTLAEAEMPDGTRMLGLSYLGGISRETTAMLGEVDEKEIIVFVDNGGSEKALEAALDKKGHSELNIFVVEKYGLVFAEVSPFDTQKLVQYFRLEDEIQNDSPSD